MRIASQIIITLLLFTLTACSAPKSPDWTSGSSELYPAQNYLTGVGTGASRVEADDRARAEIAKIFNVRIEATDSSYESEWLNRSGDSSSNEYQQSLEARVTATSDKLLSGVQIAESWHDEKNRVYYSIAVLDRIKASRVLKQQMDDFDMAADEQVRRAEQSQSKLRSLGHYLKALHALDKRRELAGDLQITSPSGWVDEPSHSINDLDREANQIASSLEIFLDLKNDNKNIVRGALIRKLADIGLHLTATAPGDITIKGQVDIDEYKTEGKWNWAMASAQVEFIEPSGTVLDSERISIREGSQIDTRATILAREKLGEKLAVALVGRLTGLPD